MSRQSTASLALIALAVGSFAIGTTEFIVMGLLPDVAADFRISIPAAGTMISAYALGVVAGAPLLALITASMPRKPLLLGTMALFVAGNALTAIAPTYGVAILSRVIVAFTHGAFFGVASVIAMRLVPVERQARAIALMFSGLMLVNVPGVPFGTLLGQAFGWRMAFWAVAAFGLAAALAVWIWVPQIEVDARPNLRQDLAVVCQRDVLLALLTTVLGFGGVFTVFTYIAPALEQVSGIAPHGVSSVLLLMGLGVTLGNSIGGWLADRALMPALTGILALLALALAAFAVALGSPVGAICIAVLWGAAGFATISPLQARVVLGLLVFSAISDGTKS